MDHIDDILSSDLLQRYVLGDVSQEEKMKVDLLRIEHSAIRKELDLLERSIERMSTDNAVQPPPRARECIIKNIRDSGGTSVQPTNASVPARPWLKMVGALAMGALGAWLVMQAGLQEARSTISDQRDRLEILERDCDRLTQQYAFINHTNTLPMLLQGTDLGQESQVIVYWNESLQRSMLRVVQLPAIRSDETYQLWADVDGVMLSLGVFEASEAIVDAIAMNYLDDATSLNITVEPKGGSEHPDVSRLTASVTI